MSLKGDMTDVIMPTPKSGYYEVLHDPFGLNAFLKTINHPK